MQAQRDLKHHASLQPLISAVKHARSCLNAEQGHPDEATRIQAAIEAVSQALKRHATVPQAAADCVKKLHGSLGKLGRSIEKTMAHADNVEACVPPLPAAAQQRVRRSLLGACALSLATLGHVDAAEQLAGSLRRDVAADDDTSSAAATAGLPSSFERYRAAAELRRRLQDGDVVAAAEVEALLQGAGHRLLLLKLHRAVVLQLLLRDADGTQQQMEVRAPAAVTCGSTNFALNFTQALAYARKHLPPFLHGPPPAPSIVSQVMAMFAFAHILKSSASSSSSSSSSSPPCPYSHQLQQWQLSALAHQLHAAVLANACLPAASPLHACVRMGNQALPPLIKCKSPPSLPFELLPQPVSNSHFFRQVRNHAESAGASSVGQRRRHPLPAVRPSRAAAPQRLRVPGVQGEELAG
jgi:hypothetical protein